MPREATGVIVEAGCYKGGSTAKLSLIAKLLNRELVAFDSFEGLPDNDERHGRSMDGMVADFYAGAYEGSLAEVRDTVRRYGSLPNTRFVKGWFSDTMVSFAEPVVGGFIDVDLVSSTRDCLKYLAPRLVPGAAIYSQDGHLPLVIEALASDEFWSREVGVPKPRMQGLGSRKLVRIESAG
jgi:O-methyltransferase